MSYNRACLVGNLGRDAELRFTTSGTPVATFSMATTEKFKGRDGEKREETEWHKIVLWGVAAETLQQYLVKGKQILVEGKITTKEWNDKEGKKQKSTEIKADRVVLLGGGGGTRRGPSHDEDERAVTPSSDSDEDIPFGWLLPFLMPALTTLTLI